VRFLRDLFLVDVSRVISYCRFQIYEDDLQIYHTCVVSDFQRCIDELSVLRLRMVLS
jgi:hypothetical protein